MMNRFNFSLIDDGLYLGARVSACDDTILEQLKITHILTIYLDPLTRSKDGSQRTYKFIRLCNSPREDLISRLPECIDFIEQAIANGGTVFVHCEQGVSRSASVVIGYMMHKKRISYGLAYFLVKTKRRSIQPNVGFVAQLQLFHRMGYRVNKDDPRFKQIRLLATRRYKLRKEEIFSEPYLDLIKPDPGLIPERPDPIVYRCKKCSRIVANQSNIIPHVPKPRKLALAQKKQTEQETIKQQNRNMRQSPARLICCNDDINNQLKSCIKQGLKCLRCQVDNMMDDKIDFDDSSDKTGPGASDDNGQDSDESYKIPGGNNEKSLKDAWIAITADAPGICRLMWFVEPLAWMKNVESSSQGKLNCPKCASKIGSFSWLNRRKCPCGESITPAFYLLLSKVERSNIVENVDIDEV